MNNLTQNSHPPTNIRLSTYSSTGLLTELSTGYAQFILDDKSIVIHNINNTTNTTTIPPQRKEKQRKNIHKKESRKERRGKI